MNYQTLESAFLQGNEKQDSELFNELMRKSVRLGFLAALQEKFAVVVEKIEAQKARQRVHLAELDALFASLQDRAFSGKM